MQFVALSLAVFLLLQSPAPTPAQTRPEDRASMSGFVVKMGTGDPLSKAIVTITTADGTRNQSYTATTNSGGQFVFPNLNPGPYRLSASRSGYVRSEFGARAPNRPGLPITVAPGQKITQIVVQLMPAGTITGRIFDRDGEPLANASVQALRYSYMEGQRVMNTVQQARTSDLGEYRLFWLAPGQYYVQAIYTEGRGQFFGGPGGGRGGFIGARGGPATTASSAAGTAEPEEGYVPVYYPGATDVQSASPINVQAGVVFSGVDLTVSAVRTLRVGGRVINGVTGQPVRNANVMLIQHQQAGLIGGVVGDMRGRNINEQGMFEIRDVAPGSYDLVAAVNDRTNRMSARVPLEVGNSDVQNVTLVLSPGFTVAGRLTLEGDTTAASADISRIRVTLRPAIGPGFGPMNGAPPAAAIQADGTFTLQQVGQDGYRIVVTGMPRNAYLKSARLGAIDVMDGGLRLDRPPTGSLELVISTKTGTVDGTVFNEKQEPSVNVTFVLVPDAMHRNRPDLYRTTSTDALGRIHLEGVPPGDYKAFAWEDAETGAWQDPEFLRLYEDQGKTVRVPESGQTNIELRAIAPRV